MTNTLNDHQRSERNEFSVCQFFEDGSYEYVRRFVSGLEAVKAAKAYSENPAARMGIVRKVIITDGGDCTNFMWEFGKGVTYPKRDASGRFVED